MSLARILWADDEIDLLKPHIMFLEQKGYEVRTTNNGDEALDLAQAEDFDIIFLDENMPGLTGIETLEKIKNLYRGIPVVMITKSEEESIMEEAIGSNIADYLIKPVKPNQILLSLKRNLENRKLVSDKMTLSYQQEFRDIAMSLMSSMSYAEWADIYKRLIRWDIELEKSGDSGMIDILKEQFREGNLQFTRFYEKNYIKWLDSSGQEKPTMSHTLMRDKLMHRLKPEMNPVFFIIIDNLRYDQWKVIQPLIENYYRVETDEIYYSIIPSTTQYARNAIFSGLLPNQIQKRFPNYWINEEEEGSKNQFESELLGEQLKRYGKKIKYSYHKILNLNAGKKLLDQLSNLYQNELNVIVYNFVDMLSHARTEMEIIRELAEDEAAYRSLMMSWFEHSSLFDIIKSISEQGFDMVITTDHGSIRVNDPVKLIGDRSVNTNLRYKYGRNLSYNSKELFEVSKPEDIFMPRQNVSTSFVFARANDFIAYPNNYNYYVKYYKNTFQHGGISLEEILVPYISLKAR